MQPIHEWPINRPHFREPIPEIYDAARYLDDAVSAHLQGQTKLVEDLIEVSNMPIMSFFITIHPPEPLIFQEHSPTPFSRAFTHLG